MKSMKEIFSVLNAFTFATVAGVSTVAAGNNFINTTTKGISSMTDRIFIDLGLYYSDGKSRLLNIKLDSRFDIENWIINNIGNLPAANLLTDENKAKSEESFNFLTSVLKLEAKGDGDWSTKTFEKVKVDVILFTFVRAWLNFMENHIGGLARFQWKNGETNLGASQKMSVSVQSPKRQLNSDEL
ncbi:MAG: hypothetical protein ACRC8P_01255 [Spiroplasma sp.]